MTKDERIADAETRLLGIRIQLGDPDITPEKRDTAFRRAERLLDTLEELK